MLLLFLLFRAHAGTSLELVHMYLHYHLSILSRRCAPRVEGGIAAGHMPGQARGKPEFAGGAREANWPVC